MNTMKAELILDTTAAAGTTKLVPEPIPESKPEPKSESQPGGPGQARTQLAPRRRTPWGSRLFFGLAAFVTFYGWLHRDEFIITPEYGLGYMLGLTGGSAMLLLLFYPLRKHIRFMNKLGAIRHWFRIHMALGVIGPIMVLYHCNFSLGSVNSNVALFSMLIVAGSGLIGRFIYTRIHHGLYGQRLTMQELRASLDQQKDRLGQMFDSMPRVQEYLASLEKMVLRRRNFTLQLLYIPIIAMNIRWKRRWIKKLLKKDIRKITAAKIQHDDGEREAVKDSLRMISVYLDTTRKTGQLMTYERMFAIWHVLHLPLFVMLIITGFIHVFAVHVY